MLDVDGAVAGYATFAPASGRGVTGAAEIQEIYLRPEYQGIGLGSRLFAAALKRIKSRGYGRVLVRALAENDRATGFHTRRGGRLIARTDENSADAPFPASGGTNSELRRILRVRASHPRNRCARHEPRRQNTFG